MDWKGLVKSIAPVIGGSLGGPLGAIATGWLADKLGVDKDALESTVVNANPDTLFKIRQLDADFKIEMKKIGLSEKELHAKDRDSARNMAINTTLIPQAIISSIFITGFIAVLYALFSGTIELSGSVRDIAGILLGILSSGIAQIMNFFFGSSAGSKEKTAKLMK